MDDDPVLELTGWGCPTKDLFMLRSFYALLWGSLIIYFCSSFRVAGISDLIP
jgi:hypothetical protein